MYMYKKKNRIEYTRNTQNEPSIEIDLKCVHICTEKAEENRFVQLTILVDRTANHSTCTGHISRIKIPLKHYLAALDAQWKVPSLAMKAIAIVGYEINYNQVYYVSIKYLNYIMAHRTVSYTCTSNSHTLLNA